MQTFALATSWSDLNRPRVYATIRERSSDAVTRVHAKYMIGAYGAHSTVRELLGI